MDIENKSIQELLALELNDLDNMPMTELYKLRDKLSELKEFSTIYNLGYIIGHFENSTC